MLREFLRGKSTCWESFKESRARVERVSKSQEHVLREFQRGKSTCWESFKDLKARVERVSKRQEHVLREFQRVKSTCWPMTGSLCTCRGQALLAMHVFFHHLDYEKQRTDSLMFHRPGVSTDNAYVWLYWWRWPTCDFIDPRLYTLRSNMLYVTLLATVEILRMLLHANPLILIMWSA